MEIYYLNDEQAVVHVQVNGQLKPSDTNPYGEPTTEDFWLLPTEGKIFFVDAPENTIPYVKKWDHPHKKVLLTYIHPDVVRNR